jgi:hypothetical protein
MGGERLAFFPKADVAVLASRHAAPSEAPATTSLTLDLESADKPLDPWTQEQVAAVYPARLDIGTPSPIPAKTECPTRCYTDRYLFPVLTRNERLRLTLLYYYTRGALEGLISLNGLSRCIANFLTVRSFCVECIILGRRI